MAKKKPNRKNNSRRRASSAADNPLALPDPRTMEAMLRQMLGGEEASGHPDSPLGRAQKVLEEAYEETSPVRCVELARQAIALCPDCAIGASGLNTGDYLNWVNGTMSGTGTTTIGPYAALNLTGQITLTDREIDNNGTVTWSSGTLASISGSTIHNEKGGVFDFEDRSDTIPTFNNDGTLEVGSGSTLRITTFTQSSTGTLQSDIAGASAFGVLDVTGAATLDGTLQAQLENGYQPSPGSSFKVLSGSSSGQFATVAPSGWTAQYDASDVTLVDG